MSLRRVAATAMPQLLLIPRRTACPEFARRRWFSGEGATAAAAAAAAPPSAAADTPHAPPAILYTTLRDRCVKVVGDGGLVRSSFAQLPAAVREAAARQGLAHDHPALAVLAETMTTAVLLASFQGGEERVVIDYQLADIGYTAEASAVGAVRGVVHGGSKEGGVPPSLRVSRILYNLQRPVVSATPATSGNFQEDYKAHAVQSDGIGCALWTSVDIPRGICVGALLQRIPSTADVSPPSPEYFADVESALAAHTEFEDDVAHAGSALRAVYGGDLTALFDEVKFVPRRAGREVTGLGTHAMDADVAATRILIDFSCKCSIEAFSRGLAAMGRARLSSLCFEQPACPLRCDQCGKTYTMNPDAWRAALALTEEEVAPEEAASPHDRPEAGAVGGNAS